MSFTFRSSLIDLSHVDRKGLTHLYVMRLAHIHFRNKSDLVSKYQLSIQFCVLTSYSPIKYLIIHCYFSKTFLHCIMTQCMFKMMFITLKAQYPWLMISNTIHILVVFPELICVARENYHNLRGSGCICIIGGKEIDALHPTILISVVSTISAAHSVENGQN
jgi:hypothetical protein